ncbi:MAG: hypothetical protein MJ160_05835 [Treponema sp.]|nr:hypothetical protein [Treponema sp.]
MITHKDYNPEEIDLLYSLVENSVAEHKALDMETLITVLHPGDFYLYKRSPSGETFQFNGLQWKKNNKIYNLLFQPQIRFHNHIPYIEWVPIITCDEEHFSSGDLSMIKKENRISTEE